MTMSETPNHYAILGVRRGASESEIKKAFKKKAMQLHPDKNPDGEALFKKVAVAYEVLLDQRQRRLYDEALDCDIRDNVTPSHTQQQDTTPWSFRQTPVFRHPKPEVNAAAQRRRTESEAKQREQEKEFASAGMSFAAWYKKKLEAQEKAQEHARETMEQLRQKQEEEERLAREAREKAIHKEEMEARMREERIQQEMRNAERLRKDREEAEKEKAAKLWQEREMQWRKEKEEQDKQTESMMKELERNRKELKEERKKMAEEVAAINQDELAAKREQRVKRSEDLERSLKEAEENLEATRKRMEESQRRLSETEKKRMIEAELERKAMEERQRKLEETEAKWKEDVRRHEQIKKEQAGRLAAMNRAFMKDAQDARRQHEEELKAMRDETDRMERDMLARLDMIRQAKKDGRPLDLKQLKLGGELKRLEGVVNGNQSSLRRRGSQRSLGATLGSPRTGTPLQEALGNSLDSLHSTEEDVVPLSREDILIRVAQARAQRDQDQARNAAHVGSPAPEPIDSRTPTPGVTSTNLRGSLGSSTSSSADVTPTPPRSGTEGRLRHASPRPRRIKRTTSEEVKCAAVLPPRAECKTSSAPTSPTPDDAASYASSPPSTTAIARAAYHLGGMTGDSLGDDEPKRVHTPTYGRRASRTPSPHLQTCSVPV